ncbi:MAG TPA: methyltransferase [Steroidobacteraceae bacterium]|nr:methyltransferase [Steroidobacteraceae bacterium]
MSIESDSQKVSTEVRDFYERYPYPPPRDNLDAYRRAWQDQLRRRVQFHLFWPAHAYREDFSILIAGCGTSQAARHAMRWPAARVTGIDFSAVSLRHTEELRRRYQLDNLRLQQLPLERAGELAAGFDLIVCTGVLHHLPDPAAGLRALRGVLNPQGAMHLMVYAPYGRSGIYMLQEFCRGVGITANADGLQRLVEVLGALPSGHPLARLLHEAPDFRTEAALADALLHPRDRAYSVPQLFELLTANGFEFSRWLRQGPYSIHCGVMSRIAAPLQMAALPPASQYAAAELFRGTMTHHSVIACRDDEPQAAPLTGFAAEAWRGYVPLRTSESFYVQQRLPVGAVALLANRGHVTSDTSLPINARERRLLESVDGRSTIGELLSQQTHASAEAVRAFFERLWWHDQVVFDTSAGTHTAP